MTIDINQNAIVSGKLVVGPAAAGMGSGYTNGISGTSRLVKPPTTEPRGDRHVLRPGVRHLCAGRSDVDTLSQHRPG